MMPAATRFLRTAFEGLRQSWERGAGPTFASNADLDIAARDLGVGPGQLRSLAAEGRHAADLLAVRLDVLGVQSGDLAPSVLRELEATCSHCDSKRQCRRDLAAGGPKLPSYCPNATVLSGTAAG